MFSLNFYTFEMTCGVIEKHNIIIRNIGYPAFCGNSTIIKFYNCCQNFSFVFLITFHKLYLRDKMIIARAYNG